MVKAEVLRPFLEKALAAWAELDQVEADPDGDYMFRSGSAQFFVRLTEQDPPVLRFWSVLLTKVKPTPKVFRLLNAVNSELVFARVFYRDEVVILTMEIPTHNVDATEVGRACDAIGVLSDELDTRLKEELGGRTTFPDQPRDEDDAVKV